MNDEIKKKSLADSIAMPIIKGYQIGGMALALILVGTILLVGDYQGTIRDVLNI